MCETKEVITKSENANSWETGKTGNRFKIYFENAEDLRRKVEGLKQAGFIIDEPSLEKGGINNE